MCGFLFSNGPQSKEHFLSKLEIIKYRGPDFTGYEDIDGLHFGHVRLSILDLDPRSNQPFTYDNLHMVYNGEIYNYLDVKDELVKIGYSFSTESDTEVLLLGYHAWGKKVLQKINGMFAFLIYDKQKQEIFGARDRLGVKPLYYFLGTKEFEVCSQLKPISCDKQLNLDENAISMFLDCKFIPSPYSIYKEIKKLEPGHCFNYSLTNHTFNSEKYWDLKEVVRFNGSYEDAKEQLKALFEDAVKIRLFSDVPLGSFLSGGVDSALVTSYASKLNKEPLNTFTVGFQEKDFDESAVAEKYAQKFKTNHKTLICNPKGILKNLPVLLKVYDEPFADNSALPSLMLNFMTKKYVTVALSGDGGDESFLGYNHFESLLKNKRIMSAPYFIRKMAAIVLSPILSSDSRITSALSVRKKREYIQRIFSRMGILLNNKNNNWLGMFDPYYALSKDTLQQAADLNIKLWLDGDSNVKVDRASMAYAVEVRSPFLDYRIVEFARTLPIEYRIQLGNKKRILKDILGEHLPPELFDLPKRGFSMPLENWLRNELRKDVETSIDENFFNKVPNLNITYCKKILNEHLNKGKDHTESIWKLYILAKWMQAQ